MKNIKLTRVIHAPVGMPSKKTVSINPHKKLITDITTELTVTEKKDLKTLIEDIAGKTINADISSEPIRRIPITTVIAVRTAVKTLYTPT